MFVWIHGKALPKQAWWRHYPLSTNRRPQPYQIEGRPTEEEERVRENNDVKEFIQTLDEPMVRKLCIRRLRRGVGSMDFMQGLLIMDESDVTTTPTDLVPLLIFLAVRMLGHQILLHLLATMPYHGASVGCVK